MLRSDEDLMLEFQKDGSDDVFAELVERHQRGLLNFFFQNCWNRDLAEDLSQEVFCRVFGHRHNYRVSAKFSTYLYSIARNLWIDYTRSRKNKPRPVSLDAERTGGASLSETELKRTVPRHQPEVDEGIIEEELAERVRQALAELPEEQRAVFVLTRNQGMKYSEVAEALDIPVGTVRSRMHTATKKLQKLLKGLMNRVD